MNYKDIGESLEHFDHNVGVELKNLTPVYVFNKILRRQIPETHNGGFALAAHLSDKQTHKEYALRIWTNKIGDIKTRSEKISIYLAKNESSYFAKYKYIPNALKVSGKWEDSILMDWIEGDTLYKFINKTIKQSDSSKIFRELAEKFRGLFEWMHNKRISHGDLQHENIIVDNSLNITLCDYDSVCVPSLEGLPIVTQGFTGYQHPLKFTKSNLTCSCKDDFFSELVIYLSLYLLSVDSSLWDHVDSKEQYFIFNENDFKKIINGEKCAKLDKVRNLQIQDKDLQDQIISLIELLISNLKCISLDDIQPIPGLGCIGSDIAVDSDNNDYYIEEPTIVNKVDESPKTTVMHKDVNVLHSTQNTCPHCGVEISSIDVHYCPNCHGKVSLKKFNL